MKNTACRTDGRRVTRLEIARGTATALWLLLFSLASVPLSAGADKKADKKKNSTDPYSTAELETAPPVNASDLAYRVVLFEEFEIPETLKEDASKNVAETERQTIERLQSTGAFTKVERITATLPEEPYLVVKCTLLEHRMISKKTRFFAGAFAGTSYITYGMKVYDGQSGDLLHDLKLSTENNAIAAAWSMNDKGIPFFLGNAIADYLALRARTDKGVSVIPLDWPTK